jgi:pilus assembly protein Flp/PilA
MGYKARKALVLERGQGLVEYALALVLVAVVVIVIVSLFGKAVQKQYCGIVYSIDANADVPLCEALDVSCSVISSNPLRMEARVTDSAGANNVTQVQWFVDGRLYNTEAQPKYCLQAGDASCEAFRGGSGSHEVRAVARDADGNVGECTTTVTAP